MRLTPTGSIRNRLLFCRLLNKMMDDPEYSSRLGLTVVIVQEEYDDRHLPLARDPRRPHAAPEKSIPLYSAEQSLSHTQNSQEEEKQ